MADNALIPTRRSFLGALAIAPVVMVAPALPAMAAPSSEWEAALARNAAAEKVYFEAVEAEDAIADLYFKLRPEKPSMTHGKRRMLSAAPILATKRPGSKRRNWVAKAAGPSTT